MSTKEEILNSILESRQQIRKYGVKRIGLFGSFITGEQKSACMQGAASSTLTIICCA